MGRGVDDGSTERLLVSNLLQRHMETEEVTQSGSLKHSTPRSRSPAPPRAELKPSQIQHLLGLQPEFKKYACITC